MPVIATLTAPSSGGIDDVGDEFGPIDGAASNLLSDCVLESVPAIEGTSSAELSIDELGRQAFSLRIGINAHRPSSCNRNRCSPRSTLRTSRIWSIAVGQEMASSSKFSHPAALLEAAAWKDCQVTPPTRS